MTDFAKLLKSYQETIDALKYLESDRDRMAHASMQLNIIAGDIFVELFEYKKKYGENDRYLAAMERYEKLYVLGKQFDQMFAISEKYRIAYKDLMEKYGSVCSLLEHTEKKLERTTKDYREVLLMV
jgi:hypothetical protein